MNGLSMQVANETADLLPFLETVLHFDHGKETLSTAKRLSLDQRLVTIKLPSLLNRQCCMVR